MSSCGQSAPPAKITKTVTLPPLAAGMSGKGKNSGEKSVLKARKKKKKEPSSLSLTGRADEVSSIDCPAAVSKILTQKTSQQQMTASHTTGQLSCNGGTSRRDREARFLKRVGQIAKEEKANRLRWY